MIKQRTQLHMHMSILIMYFSVIGRLSHSITVKNTLICLKCLLQYISAIRSEVGPEKIDHISNKTIYQILLWKGVMVGMKG